MRGYQALSPEDYNFLTVDVKGTIGIGFVTAWSYSISMFFSMQDLDGVYNTATLVPILELFNQALGNWGGAIVLEALVVATAIGCLIASHTWQSRLCWSFARDGGVPASRWLAHVHSGLDVPLHAHLVSCVVVGLLGLLYLGSSTAFNRYAVSARLVPITTPPLFRECYDSHTSVTISMLGFC